uniref:Nad2 protein n=1 Tax=Chlamydomonas leiostraca TaxID=1034604 RepID=A0A0C5BWK8_9CHLO|nr:NADH dehydrogenase subunit 2 [Chlamydomonas leiostraca]AJN90470.1 NADH dehydrogenase subunit 2 [Chlamydomonas leiostraca]
MFWYSLIELDSLLSLILIIVYGLFSLRSVNIHLADVYFFCRLYPILFVLGYYIDSCATTFTLSIDILLAALVFVIMYSFNSFESVLLLLFAFIGSYFMLHSVDLLTFYIALEAQNFSFLVLCGLQSNKDSSSFSVEAALKYFLLSAFSSGVLLFWFSTIYLQTGCSVLSFSNSLESSPLQTFMILTAMMFKLGAAPLHLWVVQIYSSVKRSLLMYISTAPKLSLFGFWVSSFHAVWTDFSVVLFAMFSIVLGSFGAYSQPALRAVFAYSTVNEIGLMLMALETAGFSSLFQHLGIYIVSQILLWNLDDKRLFSVAAVSLAGLPPLAGFFGKAWIFWATINATGKNTTSADVSSLTSYSNLYIVLMVALFCSGVSLVYYLRVLRLFWNNSQGVNCRVIQFNRPRSVSISTVSAYMPLDSRVMLISTCVILLVFLPIFLIKPFVF